MSCAQVFPLQPVLMGPTLELRPLQEEDFEALYAAASDPLVWAQHPNPLRYQRTVFEEWFRDALASRGALVVIDKSTGKIIGTSRYYEWDEKGSSVAIGFTFLARAYWGGATNGELKKLMLDHAFQWVRTVWFHVASQNVRSQKAMAKIDARLSHQEVKQFTGGPQEYLFFRIEADDPWRFERPLLITTETSQPD